jgi:hypothetical protein
MSDRSQYLVYGLVDPRNGQVRYVGLSHKGLARPREHRQPTYMNRETHTHKTRWIRALQKQGLIYEIVVLYSAPTPEGLLEAEAFWERQMRERGHSLTNAAPCGLPGPRGFRHTPDARAKMSASHRGKTKTKEHRANIARGNMRPVRRISPITGEIRDYPSARAACVDGPFCSGHISRCCQGKLRTHGGFRWSYLQGGKRR